MPDPAPRPGLHEELTRAAYEAIAGNDGLALTDAEVWTRQARAAVSTLLPLIEKRLLSESVERAVGDLLLGWPGPPITGNAAPVLEWNRERARAALRAAWDEALGGGE